MQPIRTPSLFPWLAPSFSFVNHFDVIAVSSSNIGGNGTEPSVCLCGVLRTKVCHVSEVTGAHEDDDQNLNPNTSSGAFKICSLCCGLRQIHLEDPQNDWFLIA